MNMNQMIAGKVFDCHRGDRMFQVTVVAPYDDEFQLVEVQRLDGRKVIVPAAALSERGGKAPKRKGEPDLVDRVEQLVEDFRAVNKLIHAPDAPLTTDEILAFESAHNRVRYYLAGWGR